MKNPILAYDHVGIYGNPMHIIFYIVYSNSKHWLFHERNGHVEFASSYVKEGSIKERGWITIKADNGEGE